MLCETARLAPVVLRVLDAPLWRRRQHAQHLTQRDQLLQRNQCAGHQYEVSSLVRCRLVPDTLTPADAQVKADSSEIVPPTRVCKSDGDGGTLCGIGVGYKGTGRTGVYYLPKASHSLGFSVMVCANQHLGRPQGHQLRRRLPPAEWELRALDACPAQLLPCPSISAQLQRFDEYHSSSSTYAVLFVVHAENCTADRRCGQWLVQASAASLVFDIAFEVPYEGE